MAFGLWSLAVEAMGQALLLDDQVSNQPPEELVRVQPEFDHRRSLARGLSDLPTLTDTPLARVLAISAASDRPRAIKDPLSAAQVFAPAFITGLLEDVTDGVETPQSSVELRLRLLYVKWDGASQAWTDGRVPHGSPYDRSSWEVSRGDLHRAIVILNERLSAA